MIAAAQSAPTLAKLGTAGGRPDDDSSSVLSVATSAMTLHTTDHSREQRDKRGLHDKRALKHVVKHAWKEGTTRPSTSSDGRPTIVHELDELAVVTDLAGKVEVTAWKPGQ